MESRESAVKPEDCGTVEKLESAHRYITRKFHQVPRLRDVASFVGMPKRRLEQAYRDRFGVTPKGHVTQLQIAEAKRLMLQGVPLKSIAVRIGWCSQSTFTLRFRQIVGRTPANWMREQGLEPQREVRSRDLGLSCYAAAVGKQFGRLTVESIERGKPNRPPLLVCRCECGELRRILAPSVISGRSTSCGCYSRELIGKRKTLHGGSTRPEWKVWTGMKRRCLNPNSERYPRYGGRGIRICDRWLESFGNFFEDMGPRPSSLHTIEREDNNGNYEPGNCRWATVREQSQNTSRTVRLSHDGLTLPQSEWAKRLGISGSYLCELRKSGLEIGQIIERLQDGPRRKRKASIERSAL